VEAYPQLPVYRSGLAHFYAEIGRLPDAQAEIDRLAMANFADLVRDEFWLTLLDGTAHACSETGDQRRAAILYELLLPYAGLNNVIGAGVACWGSLSRALARLASTLQRWDAAAGHFHDALAMHARLGSPPLVARTQYDHARMLLARAARGDRERARELLTQACDTTERLGMVGVHAKARALLDDSERTCALSRTGTAPVSPPGLEPAARENALRRVDRPGSDHGSETPARPPRAVLPPAPAVPDSLFCLDGEH
jgi:hypothetical protein